MEFSNPKFQIAFERASDSRNKGKYGDAYMTYCKLLDNSDLQGDDRILVLDKTLTLVEEVFGLFDWKLIKHSEDLLETTKGEDTGANFILGRAYSLIARESCLQGDAAGAEEMFNKSETYLRAVTDTGYASPDHWGTLGGVYKRLVKWMLENQETSNIKESDIRQFEDKMLDAYWSGFQTIKHAYPIFNFVEQRAIVTLRRGSDDYRFIFRAGDDKLINDMDMALRCREKQFKEQEDRPWAAFDIARGKHYLNPNVPKFLAQLKEGLDDAREVATSYNDKWMIETTILSLEQLQTAGVYLEGLTEGIELLKSGIEKSHWDAGNWEAEGYLESELHDVAQKLGALKEQLDSSAGLQNQLQTFLSETNRRWTEEDEAKFEEDAKAFIEKDCDPMLKKCLRIAWRVGGKKAIELGANAVLPGSGGVASKAIDIITGGVPS